MKECYALRRDQLLYFFRDAGSDSFELNSLIDSLIYDEKILDFDPINPEIIRYRTAPKISGLELYRHIQAFWFIGNLGSKRVRSVRMLTDCGEYLFRIYSHEEGFEFSQKLFDISYIREEKEAAMNALTMERVCKVNGDSEDLIQHIALAANRELAEKLRKYDYRIAAVLNEKNQPELVFRK